MSGNVDVSRKHGRSMHGWPSGLECPFVARHFRGRRRHDMQTVAAYAAYRRGREWKGGKP
jgi:hypothetical protein